MSVSSPDARSAVELVPIHPDSGTARAPVATAEPEHALPPDTARTTLALRTRAWLRKPVSVRRLLLGTAAGGLLGSGVTAGVHHLRSRRGAASAPAAKPDAAATYLDDLFGRRDNVVRNGSLFVDGAIAPDFARAAAYLKRSPQYEAFLGELTHGPYTVIAPRPRGMSDDAPFIESIRSVVDENGRDSYASVVHWDPARGRTAQSLPDADGNVVCRKQSSSIELIRRLFASYGLQRHPASTRMLQCLGDAFFGSQYGYRVNEKISQGLSELGEPSTRFSGRLVPATGSTDHGACTPEVDALTSAARERYPALEDLNAPACGMVYHAPYLNANDIGVENARARTNDAEVRLPDATLRAMSDLKDRSLHLETRIADAARAHGTSPEAFARENEGIRRETQDLLARNDRRAGTARDPFFHLRGDAAPARASGADGVPARAGHGEAQSQHEASSRDAGLDAPSAHAPSAHAPAPKALPRRFVR